VIRDLPRVLDLSFGRGLADASIEQFRAMRAECAEFENGASIVLRLAQGRLNLLGEEAKRRADGAGGNLGELVSGLADLMSEAMRAAGSGCLDQELNPPEAVVGPFTALLDAGVDPSVVMAVVELSDDELSAALHALQDFEKELSSARCSLHREIDVLKPNSPAASSWANRLRPRAEFVSWEPIVRECVSVVASWRRQ
jgi:hypothetical protein